jgi:hypothetical protein
MEAPSNEAGTFFCNTRTIELACERRDGDGQRETVDAVEQAKTLAASIRNLRGLSVSLRLRGRHGSPPKKFADRKCLAGAIVSALSLLHFASIELIDAAENGWPRSLRCPRAASSAEMSRSDR